MSTTPTPPGDDKHSTFDRMEDAGSSALKTYSAWRAAQPFVAGLLTGFLLGLVAAHVWTWL